MNKGGLRNKLMFRIAKFELVFDVGAEIISIIFENSKKSETFIYLIKTLKLHMYKNFITGSLKILYGSCLSTF